MTQGKRILVNVIATYGRSLYSLAIGLFTARWILQALGSEDYGLVGLVGGMVGFVSVFNAILASAVGRFYAVSVGAARQVGGAGVEDCRKWFNTALLVHTCIPIFLICVGLPVGFWMINEFLVIPEGRISACRIIWCFTCLSSFVGMFTVPFQAMYTAKQEIAELTVYGVVATTFNAIFLYYMVSHPGFWLVKYSMWAAFVSVAPHLIIAVRAVVKYPECKFRVKYLYDKGRITSLAKYAVARFWSDFSSMLSVQGQSLLVNKFMGVNYNAAMSIGSRVAGQALTLANSLSGAFWPAIANKCGENRPEEARMFSGVACRMGAVLVLVFALPLCVEIDEVLKLWLITPPDFSGWIVIAVLFRMCFLRMTDGYWMMILGTGKGVMAYSWTIGWAEIGLLLVSWICFICGFNMWSIVAGYVFSTVTCVVVRLIYGRILLSMSVRHWILNVLLPTGVVASLSVIVALCVRSMISPSLFRVVISTCLCEMIFLPSVWFFVLTPTERDIVAKRMVGGVKRFLS